MRQAAGCWFETFLETFLLFLKCDFMETNMNSSCSPEPRAFYSHPSNAHTLFDGVMILGGVSLKCTWKKMMHMKLDMTCQSKKRSFSNGESDSLLPWEKPLIWWCVESGKCSFFFQLGRDQVTEAAVTNGLCTSQSHQSQWPIEAHNLTERAQIGPGVLRRRMTDDYSVLRWIYSYSFCAPRSLGPRQENLTSQV